MKATAMRWHIPPTTFRNRVLGKVQGLGIRSGGRGDPRILTMGELQRILSKVNHNLDLSEPN